MVRYVYYCVYYLSMFTLFMISNIAGLDVWLLHWFDILMSERGVCRVVQRLNVSQPAMSLVLRR